MNLWIIFLTGLTTGGLSCLAMQGGLLASIITNQKEKDIEGKHKSSSFGKDDWLPVTTFLGAKLVAHVILGFLLGAIGSTISLSTNAKLVFQTFTALFMFATAMNLLDVHPIFRYVLIQPPKFIRKKIRAISKDDSLFAPGLLGLFTVFVPCGVTQAMEVLAINIADPVDGALIMGAFILGTSPLFTLIGVATSRLSEIWQDKFMKVAAYSLIAMALYGINGVLVAADAPISVQRLIEMRDTVKAIESGQAQPTNLAQTADGVQKVAMQVLQTGYSPNRFQVRQGIPVELTLNSKDVYTCASAFVFREFGLSANLKPTDARTFTFTPTKKGRFTYSCSMGMYSGVMEVI